MGGSGRGRGRRPEAQILCYFGVRSGQARPRPGPDPVMSTKRSNKRKKRPPRQL